MKDKLKEIKSIIEMAVPNTMTKIRGKYIMEDLLKVYTPTKEGTLYYDGTYQHIFKCTHCDEQIKVESDDTRAKPPLHCHACGCFLREV